MKPESYREIIDGALDSGMPQHVDLLPQLATRFTKGQSAMQTRKKVTLALALALVVVIVALFSVPGVVAAVQHLFGYVPNVGVVDQALAPVRKLAQPVSQTRDGLTVTVEAATLTSTSTLLHIVTTGIPASAYPPDTDLSQLTCTSYPFLRLPGGAISNITGWIPGFGRGSTETDGDWNLFPLPGNDDSATLVVPCIWDTLPGKTPENWELSLQFIPADPKDILPVIDPASGMIVTPDPGQPPAPLGGILRLDSIVPMPDGDALYATLQWPDSSRFEETDVTAFHLADANGQLIPAGQVFDLGASLHKGDPFVSFGIKTAAPIQSAGPLTLTIDEVMVYPISDQEFVVDTGPDPQVGQQWSLDQEAGAPEYHLRLLSVTRLADGYRLSFQTGSLGALSLRAFIIDGDSYPIGDCLPQAENLDCTIKYTTKPPVGRLRIGYEPTITLTGPWQITWQP